MNDLIMYLSMLGLVLWLIFDVVTRPDRDLGASRGYKTHGEAPRRPVDGRNGLSATKTPRATVHRYVAACPRRIVAPDHYRQDGRCRCHR